MGGDDATLAAYARHATEYADDWLTQPPPTDLQDAVRAHFRSGAQGGITGDIGCGAGRDVDWLNRNGYPCVGFDASDALLAEARRRSATGASRSRRCRRCPRSRRGPSTTCCAKPSSCT